MSGPAEGHSRPRAPADVPPGFRWMYTRGYDLTAPVSFAFRWMEAHAPPLGRGLAGTEKSTDERPRPSEPLVERRGYPERGTERLTKWELNPPDRVTFHDAVYRRGRLVVQGVERYRFLGGDDSGCIVEVTALRKPVGWLSRLGFVLFPEWSLRTRRQEAELLAEIERDYRSGRIRATSAVNAPEPA